MYLLALRALQALAEQHTAGEFPADADPSALAELVKVLAECPGPGLYPRGTRRVVRSNSTRRSRLRRSFHSTADPQRRFEAWKDWQKSDG
jgi:hypothetical protein